MTNINFSKELLMIKLHKRMVAMRKSQKGLTTVEYAIAGGLISAAVIGGFTLLGANVAGVIAALAGALAPIAAGI
jgi:pilus assembly protein Flp/PilA